MKLSLRTAVPMAVLSVVALTSTPRPAHATCEALPVVEGWQSTHDQVITFVGNKHKGNWDVYVARWEKYRDSMQAKSDRGGTAVIKSRNLELRGDALRDYVAAITTRVSVLNCLALEAKLGGQEQTIFPSAQEGGDLIELSTRTGNQVVAEYAVEVLARCDGSSATFKIINRGKKWPQAAALSVYRTKNIGVVEEKLHRLDHGQSANVRVPPQQGRNAQEVALWVQPSWFLRRFKFDSRLTCN